MSSRYEDRSLVGSLPTTSLVSATAAASGSTNSEPLPPPSSSSSSSSYNSLVAIVGKRTGMSAKQAERAVGFSAITGTILLAMKITMYAYHTLQGDDKSYDEVSDSSTTITKEHIPLRQTRRASHSILGVFRRTLRKILLDDSEFIARAPPAIADDVDNAKRDLEEKLVTHQGSCHCESIQFTILAPPVIRAQDGPGKIQFRHVSVKASTFRVYAGFENLKTYYVAYRDSGDKGAHAFCERCGVHILYAPSKSSPNVSINIRCLRDDESRKVKLTSKKDTISDGIPIAGQFDQANSDQLSTISEVTQPFHFQMNNANHNPTNFDYLNRNYPIPRPARNLSRKQSDVSSIASPITSDDGNGIGIPIKQFYAPSTTNTHQLQKNRRSTFSAGTASLTDIESSGSLYRGTINGRAGLLPPMSPARSGAASFGGIDDFSFTGESISLMGDDNMSLTSAARSKLGTISIRGNLENEMVAGNAIPRHPTVTSPETRNKMKYFMSKYKKNAAKTESERKRESI